MDNTDTTVGTSDAQNTDNDAAKPVQSMDTTAPTENGNNISADVKAPIVGSPSPSAPEGTATSGGNIPLQPVQAQAAPQVTQPVVTANTPSAPGQVQDNTPTHPGVQKANLLRDIAWGLSGGQRYDYSVNSDGKTVKTERPISGGRLALAAALSVISKGLTGASFNGAPPGEAAKFFDKQKQEKQQQDQQAQAKAQQDFQNQETVKLRQAQNMEVNSRTMLNIAQSEKLGLEAIQEQATISAGSIQEQKDNGNVAEGGEHITEDQFRDGQKSGKFQFSDMQGGVDGVAYKNGKAVPTFTIVHDPSAPAKLTQEKWDALSQVFPKTFKPGSKVGDNTTMSYSQLNGFEQKLGVVKNMQAEHDAITGMLSSSSDPNIKTLADGMKPIESLLKDPESNPELMDGLLHAQRYLSGHSPSDIYEQLQTMKHPQTAVQLSPQQLALAKNQYNQAVKSGYTDSFGQWQQDNKIGTKPNPDAKYADTVANAFGGWEALGKVHEASPAIQSQKDEYNQYYNAVAPKDQTTTNIIPVTGPNPTKLANVLDSAAQTNGVDPGVFRALAKVESNFSPEVEGITPKTGQKSGAQGLLQLTHGTQKELGMAGDDWKDPFKNANGGAKYLAGLLAKPDINGDYDKAIAAYHDGYGAFQKAGGDISKMSAEAQQEVKDVSKLTTLKTNAEGTPTGNPADRSGLSTDQWDFIAQHGGLGVFTGKTSEGISPIQKFANDHPGKLDDSMIAGVTATLNRADPDGNGLTKYRNTQAQEASTGLADAKQAGHDKQIVSKNSALVNDLASGKNIDITKLASMRSGDREALFNAVRDLNPSFNPDSVTRTIKVVNDFSDSNSKSSPAFAVKGFNTSFQHTANAIQTMQELQKEHPEAMKNFFGAASLQQLNKFFGNDPKWNYYLTERNAAVEDWQNALKNQGTPTQQEVERADEITSPKSPAVNQISSLRAMANTAAVRVVPLNEQYRQATGVNFPNMIEPNTVDAIKRIGDSNVNRYLADMESGGTVINGPKGIGDKGQRVGDLLQPQKQPTIADVPKGGTPYYKKGPDGKPTNQLLGYMYNNQWKAF